MMEEINVVGIGPSFDLNNLKDLKIEFIKEADENNQLYGAVSKKEIQQFLEERDIGLLSDDIKILQTIKYSKTLELDRIGVSYFQPYPGTREYDDLVECGKFSYDMNLMKLSLHTINYINDNLTKRQLYWLRRRAFFAFYFRWKIVVKLLKEVRNIEHMMFILKRAMHWLTS